MPIIKIAESLIFSDLSQPVIAKTPNKVLSEYKYQDGTAYYESTRDAATHFFFDSLRKGTYVLEYTVRANNAGNFSNGITNIESMYAPEFSGHTKGIRVEIND